MFSLNKLYLCDTIEENIINPVQINDQAESRNNPQDKNNEDSSELVDSYDSEAARIYGLEPQSSHQLYNFSKHL